MDDSPEKENAVLSGGTQGGPGKHSTFTAAVKSAQGVELENRLWEHAEEFVRELFSVVRREDTMLVINDGARKIAVDLSTSKLTVNGEEKTLLDFAAIAKPKLKSADLITWLEWLLDEFNGNLGLRLPAPVAPAGHAPAKLGEHGSNDTLGKHENDIEQGPTSAGTYQPRMNGQQPEGDAPTGVIVSMFGNAMKVAPRDVLLSDLLHAIRNGRWEAEIKNLRAALASGNEERYKAGKLELPAFMPSGRTVGGRRLEHFSEHSGLMSFDLDAKDNPSFAETGIATIRAQLALDPHVRFVFTSPSGAGLKGAMPVPPSVEGHEAAFHAVAHYFQATYGLAVDPACKDPVRLCFVSHDPVLYDNPGARQLDIAKWKLIASAEEIFSPSPNSPTTIDADIVAEVQKTFGPLYFEHEDRHGNMRFDGINESSWAGYLAATKITLYEPCGGSFYRYDQSTGLYSLITTDALKQEVSARLLAAGRDPFYTPQLTSSRSDRQLAAVVNQFKGIVEEKGAFDGEKRFVHLANGVLRFRDDGGADLVAFSPQFRSRNRSPIPFMGGAKCERFLDQLVRPAVTPDDVLLLQKFGGMCLLGRNLIQRLLVLDGLAGRGKTQYANVLQGVVGRANISQLRTHLLCERFEISRYAGKTLLVGVDVSPDFLSTKGASVLKGLVGGDWFDAERKGSNMNFPLQGTWNVLVTSNSRLRVRLSGDIGAWRRRLMICRFEAPPPAVKIPDFADKLLAEEGSGILSWLIDGLGYLFDDIATTGDIVMTPRQHGLVDSLLAESDSLREFLKDKVTRAEGEALAVEQIIEAYAAYCPTRGWDPLPITEIRRALETLMLELFQVGKAHNVEFEGSTRRGFRGVKLLEVEV